jgi:dihydroxyacetone kinase
MLKALRNNGISGNEVLSGVITILHRRGRYGRNERGPLFVSDIASWLDHRFITPITSKIFFSALAQGLAKSSSETATRQVWCTAPEAALAYLYIYIWAQGISYQGCADP